jgi:hypothetical protein
MSQHRCNPGVEADSVHPFMVLRPRVDPLEYRRCIAQIAANTLLLIHNIRCPTAQLKAYERTRDSTTGDSDKVHKLALSRGKSPRCKMKSSSSPRSNAAAGV